VGCTVKDITRECERLLKEADMRDNIYSARIIDASNDLKDCLKVLNKFYEDYDSSTDAYKLEELKAGCSRVAMSLEALLDDSTSKNRASSRELIRVSHKDMRELLKDLNQFSLKEIYVLVEDVKLIDEFYLRSNCIDFDLTVEEVQKVHSVLAKYEIPEKI